MCGELQRDRKHKEEHGHVLWLTVIPNNWGRQCKISIEVPVSEFRNDFKSFEFQNEKDVICCHNISTNSYDFKIEKVDAIEYDRIVELIKNDDDNIYRVLSYNPETKCLDYIAIANWLFNDVYSKNGLLEENSEAFNAYMEDYSNGTDIFNEFVQNPKGKMNWKPLINPSMYQKALQEFIKTGHLQTFPSKYVYQWIGIIMRNTLKLQVTTSIAGHTASYDLEGMECSNIFNYIEKNYGLEFIDFSGHYDILFKATQESVINILKSTHLSYEEQEALQQYQELNEDGVHTYGDLKGQRAMFLSQNEIDRYDYNKKLKDKTGTIEPLIEIFNNRFNRQGQEASFDKNGDIVLKVRYEWILDYIGFYEWAQFPYGTDAISDYGIEPIMKIINEYNDNSTPEQTLVLVNRALDVYHRRGDLSSIFIEGGKYTLSQISN